jgi:hypothetical protein
MIVVNMDKARTIAHDLRRAARSQEFQPWDQIIAAQIPGTDPTAAEQARQAIREKYQQVQISMDQCTNVQDLKNIIDGM